MNLQKKKKWLTAVLAIINNVLDNSDSDNDGTEIVIKKRMWVKNWIIKYGQNGHYENVQYNEWRLSDPKMYRRILWIYPEDFDNLLQAVNPYIEKECTNLRDSIPSEKRLARLRFLATG